MANVMLNAMKITFLKINVGTIIAMCIMYCIQTVIIVCKNVRETLTTSIAYAVGGDETN